MQLFTPYEYVLIALANEYGLDKLEWNKRIDWAKDNKQTILNNFEIMLPEASKPMAFAKAALALRDIHKGKETNYIMGLDATSSGIQLMGILSGCESTMKNTNTIDTGKRISFYTNVHKYMTGLGCKVTVEDVKQSIMTHYYNSTAIPRELFREEETLEAFYEALKKELMGAEEVLVDINGCWDPTISVIKWKLPNGHTVVIKNKTKKKKRINNELLGGSFTYIYDEYGPSKRGAHLPANIIHSLDGYVVHELVTACSKQGIKVLPIHDCFYASPVHMNTVRSTYNNLLADLHESNALESILQDITGDTTLEYLQFRDDLGNFIRKSNYALS